MSPRMHRPARLATTLVATVLGALLATPVLADEAAHDPGADCERLVTYTRDGAEGDTRTVSLTSQSLEADVAGWGHVSWQAGEDTDVDAVVVTGPDGTDTVTGADLATGTVDDVLAITFCGTVGATVLDQTRAGTESGDATDDEVVAVAGGSDQGSTEAGGATTSATTADHRGSAVVPATVDTSLAGLGSGIQAGAGSSSGATAPSDVITRLVANPGATPAWTTSPETAPTTATMSASTGEQVASSSGLAAAVARHSEAGSAALLIVLLAAGAAMASRPRRGIVEVRR